MPRFEARFGGRELKYSEGQMKNGLRVHGGVSNPRELRAEGDQASAGPRGCRGAAFRNAPRDARAKECDEIMKTLRMQGLEPVEEAKSMFRAYIDGALTFDEMRAAMRALRGAASPPRSWPT